MAYDLLKAKQNAPGNRNWGNQSFHMRFLFSLARKKKKNKHFFLKISLSGLLTYQSSRIAPTLDNQLVQGSAN